MGWAVHGEGLDAKDVALLAAAVEGSEDKQSRAAIKAAASIAQSFDGPVNVAVAGHVNEGDDDPSPTVVNVTVAASSMEAEA